MKSSFIGKTQYSGRFTRLIIWTLVFVVAITLLFTYSKTAHAGLLSFMNSLLGGEQASAKITPPPNSPNSQTIAILQAAANTDPNPFKTGENLPLDKNTLIADISASENAPSDVVNTQISVYTVREGDTLSGIADMYNVSVNTIMWANDISRATGIQPGQTLVILPVTGVNYTVKKGDTIKGIVAAYKADLEEVLDFNDLTLSSTLVTGQTILIPDAELASTPSSGSSGSSAGKSYPGYYLKPIAGGTKTQGIHGHNGVDLASSYGANILASAAGTVIIARSSGWNGGYGNYIVIQHNNNTQTLYAHLSSVLVSPGDIVTRGEVIGKMGNSGSVVGATGVHLHFEIRGARNPF